MSDLATKDDVRLMLQEGDRLELKETGGFTASIAIDPTDASKGYRNIENGDVITVYRLMPERSEYSSDEDYEADKNSFVYYFKCPALGLTSDKDGGIDGFPLGYVSVAKSDVADPCPTPPRTYSGERMEKCTCTADTLREKGCVCGYALQVRADRLAAEHFEASDGLLNYYWDTGVDPDVMDAAVVAAAEATNAAETAVELLEEQLSACQSEVVTAEKSLAGLVEQVTDWKTRLAEKNTAVVDCEKALKEAKEKTNVGCTLMREAKMRALKVNGPVVLAAIRAAAEESAYPTS